MLNHATIIHKYISIYSIDLYHPDVTTLHNIYNRRSWRMKERGGGGGINFRAENRKAKLILLKSFTRLYEII